MTGSRAFVRFILTGRGTVVAITACRLGEASDGDAHSAVQFTAATTAAMDDRESLFVACVPRREL